MSEPARVILSGFTDEAAAQKSLDQQFSVCAALGLRHFAIRFVDAGSGIKNVSNLSDEEVAAVRQKMEAYGLRVSSLGSPIGKIKLFDFDDGTPNRHEGQREYLAGEVSRVCVLAQALRTRLVRGFSFYPPRGSDPREFLEPAVDRLREIVQACDEHGLTFGLEVEANLVGRDGWLLQEIHRRIDHPALMLVFDGANLSVQGFSAEQIFEQYLAMKPGLGWIHVKDYRHPAPIRPDSGTNEARSTGSVIDEERLRHFVPVGQGESAYPEVFRDLRGFLPTLSRRLAERQIEGVFLELEPHLKAGGQFGGFSGADGFGVALRSLIELLRQVGIECGVLDWKQMVEAAD